MEQFKHIQADGFKGERAIVTPYNIRSFQAANTITKQLYITHIGYYPHAKNHYRLREEGTPEYVFIYCEKGAGWIEYGEKRYPLRENSFFIIPAHEKHAYGADSRNPWSIYWLHFQGECVTQFATLMGRAITLNQAANSRHHERLQLFNEMYQNLEMGYNPENLEYTSFCLRYFLASLKYVAQYREVKKIKEEDVIQKTILFMKDHLEEKMTMEVLAKAMGYSPSHLNALFAQRTSYSPMEYFNQLKVQRVCSYLQFSTLKIKEIAFKLNYYDPFHLSKAFTREMGITPKEYRKRYQDVTAES